VELEQRGRVDCQGSLVGHGGLQILVNYFYSGLRSRIWLLSGVHPITAIDVEMWLVFFFLINN